MRFAPEFMVTRDPLPSPELDRLPASVRAQMANLFENLGTAPARCIAPLLEWISLYPDVHCFRNWLGSCYRLTGQSAKARELNEAVFRDFPDYLFGRMSLCHLRLDEGDVAGAEQLLFERGDTLPAVCPNVTMFHISEVRHWHYLCARIHLAHGRVSEARELRDFLQELEPDADVIADLDRRLKPGSSKEDRLIAALRKLVSESQARRPKGRG